MGYTQPQAAAVMGMSVRQYIALEKGETDINKRTELSCGAIANGIFEYPEGDEANKT